jgi:hypothetical protein
MALFAKQWGYETRPFEDELLDGLEELDLDTMECWDAAEDGDLPVGHDPLLLLIALEDAFDLA